MFSRKPNDDTCGGTPAEISSTEEIIAEAREGRMFILADDADRENEGDLVIPASACSVDSVNFMATHGRGLICLTLERSRVEALGLSLMARANRTRYQTAFTTSIEAREGVSTGISAADRARTIAVAIDPASTSEDIVSPGHVFPIVARDGGVFVRPGHTEASVDVARLAGMVPAGVICEIMNDDGTMARLPDLQRFAGRHGLRIGTIADLIAYRRRTETLVRRIETGYPGLSATDLRLFVYSNQAGDVEHLVLVKGDVATGQPVPVGVYAPSLVDNSFLGLMFGQGCTIQLAAESVTKHGCGVIILPKQGGYSLLERVTSLSQGGAYGACDGEMAVAGQILNDLGVRTALLLEGVPDMSDTLRRLGVMVAG